MLSANFNEFFFSPSVGLNVRHKLKDSLEQFLKNSKPPMKQMILLNKNVPNRHCPCEPIYCHPVRWVFIFFFFFLDWFSSNFLDFLLLLGAQAKQPSTSTTNKRLANGNSLIGFERAAKKTKIDEQKTTDYTSNIKQLQKYGDDYFYEDSDGYVHVYTDGSCENNGRPNAIAGYGVYFGEGHKL